MVDGIGNEVFSITYVSKTNESIYFKIKNFLNKDFYVNKYSEGDEIFGTSVREHGVFKVIYREKPGTSLIIYPWDDGVLQELYIFNISRLNGIFHVRMKYMESFLFFIKKFAQYETFGDIYSL